MGRVSVEAIEISYGDKLDPAHLTNMGSHQIDTVSRGAYATEPGRLKIEAVRFRADIAPHVQRYGFGTERFPMVVSFSHPDLGEDSDLLENVAIIGLQSALKQGNEITVVELGLDYTQVRWTNDRRTINLLDTARRLDPTQF